MVTHSSLFAWKILTGWLQHHTNENLSHTCILREVVVNPSGTLDFLGNEETPLREFIVKCLCGENPSGFLHFRVAEIKPIQNLVENLLVKHYLHLLRFMLKQ